MAYQALYRTWRPARFSNVVGQDHIIKVLSGQIAQGKTAHAYLFAGPRGTGKTSLAKIFAGAVNCTSRQGTEPCGKCDVCLSVASGNSVDIIEIDAASNNGVDNVRDIRDRVSLLPALCSYKVYIIDEVHMLSKGAFNALLKTLEEPPPHVIFILATTEPHKLPATIRSRCQRFDFRRIPVGIIVQRLTEVAKAESYVYEDAALTDIARAAEGGMRDALSLLDQCAATGDVTQQTVAATLGGSDLTQLTALVAHIAAYDEKAALECLRNILDAGADTRTLIKDLAGIFRRMMWIAAGAGTDADEKFIPLAETYGKSASVRALDILIGKEYEMRQNLRADIVLETAVMALMCPEDDASATDTQRLEKLEGRLKTLEQQGIRVQDAPKAPNAQPASQKKAQKQPKAANEQPALQQKTRSEQPSDIKDGATVHDIWAKLLAVLKEKAYFVFTHAQKAIEVQCASNVLELKFNADDDISAAYMKEPPAQKAIGECLSAITNRDIAISIIIEHPKEEAPVDAKIYEMFGDQNIERV